MIRFNTETLDAIRESSIAMYSDAREIFNPLRNFVDNAGDNVAVDEVKEQAARLEKVFNDTVLTAFTTFRQNCAQVVENTESWEASMRNMDKVNTSALERSEVTTKIKPIDMN